jgi:hypothetical protein
MGQKKLKKIIYVGVRCCPSGPHLQKKNKERKKERKIKRKKEIKKERNLT